MGRTATATLVMRSVDIHDDKAPPPGAVGVKGFADGNEGGWDLVAVRDTVRALVARPDGNRVVYCQAGLNRSATFAVLYLWLTSAQGTTLLAALAAVADGYVAGKKMSKKVMENLELLFVAIGAAKQRARGESFEQWAATVNRATVAERFL